MVVLHLLLNSSLPSSSPLTLHFNPCSFSFTCKCLPVKFTSSVTLTCKSAQSATPFNSTSSVSKLTPFLFSHHRPILLGWFCSSISVFSLSRIVPALGSISSDLSNGASVSHLRHKGLLLGIFLLARSVSCYFQQAFLWDAALSAVYDLRVSVFDSVLERELAFFEGAAGVPAGDIANRITSEASDVADTVYALLNTVVPSTLQLSAMATQMLVLSPALSLISALLIPCVGFIVARLGENLREISNQANLSTANLAAYLNEVLPAILFVKANSAELCERTRFKRLALVDLSGRLKKKKMKAYIPQIVQIIYFGSLCVLFMGSIVVSHGSIDGRALVSFVSSLVFLIEPLQDIGKAYNELKQGEPAIERLYDLAKSKSKKVLFVSVVEEFNDELGKEDEEKTCLLLVKLDNRRSHSRNPRVNPTHHGFPPNHVSGEVKFSDVSFKYGEKMPLILDGLNLHIKAGETIAFIGPSGGGKTTIAKLLLRLYDPSSGAIFVDNQNIEHIHLESLRQHIGLVSQDTTLFSGTVAQNIGYRDLMRKIDMEKVERAARIANADEFIRTLPEGYRSNIGPRGSNLSGGQKQRLAIARALYQNPSILILDEATSALDSKSETLVRQALERVMENHTVLVIAHRLETVLMASRIFVLDEGKLQELKRSALLDNKSNLSVENGLVI